MRRIINDVSRWSIYLHRESRGLGSVDQFDPCELRFEDELFERLYAGELQPLLEADRDPALSGWAENVHITCEQLPDFARLANECRGDALASGIAVEKLLEELRPQMKQVAQPPDAAALRRTVRSACERASAAVDKMRELTNGLDQVAFVPSPGRGTIPGDSRPGVTARSLAVRIRDDHRLKRIALLAGKFKRIAAAKRRMKVRHGADEIGDVEQGADLGRLLPAELAKLVHPRLRLAMLRDLSERRCLQYQLSGTEALGKGPLVVALDKSGSMDGAADVWATAVALALLDVAQRERRPFAMLSFDEGIKHEVVVPVGGALPEAALFVSCGGGTDIANVISRGLDIIEHHSGTLRHADVVVITDGGSPTERAAELHTRAASLGVTILGFAIGVDPVSVAPWCDETHAVDQLETLGSSTAEALFTS